MRAQGFRGASTPRNNFHEKTVSGKAQRGRKGERPQHTTSSRVAREKLEPEHAQAVSLHSINSPRGHTNSRKERKEPSLGGGKVTQGGETVKKLVEKLVASQGNSIKTGGLQQNNGRKNCHHSRGSEKSRENQQWSLKSNFGAPVITWNIGLTKRPPVEGEKKFPQENYGPLTPQKGEGLQRSDSRRQNRSVGRQQNLRETKEHRPRGENKNN